MKLYLSLAFALALGLSAKAQTFDFSFTIDNNASVASMISGQVTVASGKATDLIINPFTYHGNFATVNLPELQWTASGGVNEGTFALGQNAATVSNGSLTSINVIGTSITLTPDPTGGDEAADGSSFSIDLASSPGVTDFSGGYPFGTQYLAGSPEFTEAPEPSTLTLVMGGLGLAFLFVRRRMFEV